MWNKYDFSDIFDGELISASQLVELRCDLTVDCLA